MRLLTFWHDSVGRTKIRKFFSLAEMIEKFDIEAVGKSPGVFNAEKLLWINQHYMKEKPYEEVLAGVEHFIKIPDAKKKRSTFEGNDRCASGSRKNLG